MAGWCRYPKLSLPHPAGFFFCPETALKWLKSSKAEALKSRSETQSKFTKSGTSLAGMRKRLASELEDARVTLNFVTSAAIYTDETRPAVIQKVQAIINRLQEQLAQLGAQ